MKMALHVWTEGRTEYFSQVIKEKNMTTILDTTALVQPVHDRNTIMAPSA